MSIKTKVDGAYADIVGISHKRAGAYEAVPVFLKDGGVYGRVDATPLPAPTTVSYTSEQVAAGLFGSVSTTKNAARVYGRASLTCWVGVITGTEAKLTASSEWGANAGLIEVSIDGGAFSAAPVAAGVYTLFTGLPHAPHMVVWRFSSAYSDVAYIGSSGNVLAVTGQPPSIAVPTALAQPASVGALSFFSAATVANSANFAPALVAERVTTSYGSNVPSVRLRGAFTRLFVGKSCRYVYVSKNGGAPTRHGPIIETNAPSNGLVIALDGSLATYNVWGSSIATVGGGTFGVGGDAALVDIGAKRRLDQYGDSITESAPANGPTSEGECEVFRVASAMGFVGGASGTSGDTAATLEARMNAVLAAREVTPNDVAIIAVGRNDGTAAWDSAKQTSYTNIINKLLTKGYGKVLCRGVMNDTANFSAPNASIQAVVASLAKPNVIFIDTSTWTGYATSDGVHPNDAGYATLATLAEPAYRAALGI